MLRLVLAFSTIAFVFGTVFPLAAAAEGPAEATQLQQVLDRLEQYEQRLKKLEEEQRTLQTNHTTLKANHETLKGRAEAAERDAQLARQQAEAARAELARTQREIASMAPPVAAAPDEQPAAKPGAFASVGAVYWELDAGKERDYVIVQKSPTPPANDVQGDVKSVTWDDDIGYRIEAGWRFGNGIDVLARGVQFDTDGSDSETDPLSNMTAISLFHEEDDFADLDVGFAEVDMDVDFFQIDLEGGKWFTIGEGFDLRPFLTVRYVDFDYDLDERFCQAPNCALAIGGPEIEIHDSEVNWWGAGLLAGAEGQWTFLDRFSIFGRGAGGVLGGEYVSRGRVFEPNDINEFHLADEDGDTFVPVIEASAGLGVRLLDMDQFRINLEAGYEVLSFFDSPQPFQGLPDDMENPADFDEETVTFHGAFLRLGMDF